MWGGLTRNMKTRIIIRRLEENTKESLEEEFEWGGLIKDINTRWPKGDQKRTHKFDHVHEHKMTIRGYTRMVKKRIWMVGGGGVIRYENTRWPKRTRRNTKKSLKNCEWGGLIRYLNTRWLEKDHKRIHKKRPKNSNWGKGKLIRCEIKRGLKEKIKLRGGGGCDMNQMQGSLERTRSGYTITRMGGWSNTRTHNDYKNTKNKIQNGDQLD